MKRDDERIAQLHELLLQRVEGLVTGEDWTRFLCQSQQFHRYSAGNRLLIAAQLIERGIEPDGLTASYRAWQKIPAQDGGYCQVRKGESAMWIYAPLTVTRRIVDDQTGKERTVPVGVRGFRTVAVFHQSQLERAPQLVEPPTPELLAGMDAPAHVWDAMVAELIEAGFSVSLERREAGVTWNGQTDFVTREVRLQSDLGPNQRLKTMAHEWAHVVLHGGPAAVSRPVAEVEAESVAYLVLGSIGIDAGGYTIPYVSGWAGGSVDIVKGAAERVLAATATIVDRLEARLSVDLTPDRLVLEPLTVEPPEPVRPVAIGRFAEVAAARLDPPDRASLMERGAPAQVAFLLASAGFDSTQAAATLRELGVSRGAAATAMTAIYPYNALGRGAEPLFEPMQVQAALAGVYGHGRNALTAGSPAGGKGLELLEQWTRLERTGPAQTLDISMPGGIR